MRFPGFILAVTLGLGGITSTVRAVSATTYASVRNTTPLTTIDNVDAFFGQLAIHAGQIVELDGTVSGSFSGNGANGFLLRLASGQTLVVTLQAEDPDIEVGEPTRVLARIPVQGRVLEGLAATSPTAAGDAGNTPVTTATAPVSISGTDLGNLPAPGESIAGDTRPTTTYYRARDDSQTVTTETAPLAQQAVVVRCYTDRIKNYNRQLNDDTAEKIAYHLLDKSERYGVDPRLVFALVARESRFNPGAVSPAGAQGLGQLMPGTAAGLGVRDPFDIVENLDGTVRYLAAQLRAFGRLSHALAAYNAGPNSVKRCGGIPPYSETQNYVRLVWATYCDVAGLNPRTGEPIAAAL